MVRRVISTIMIFLLSVIKGGAWLGLHLLLAVLEILKIIFLISCNILKPELKFQVKATPFERDGSNLKGLARIYLEECFVINNVSLLQGRNGLFVAMPSYKTKQTDEQGKSIYQDICFPVTKEFREKLYSAIRTSFEESKEKQKSGEGKEQTKPSVGHDGWQEARDTPFR